MISASGEFLHVIGEKGQQFGQLHHPSGVACDHARRLVYVSDTDNHRVSVFTYEGVYKTSFAVDGSELNCPLGLAFDSRHNTLYVVDSGHHCIKVPTMQTHRP